MCPVNVHWREGQLEYKLFFVCSFLLNDHVIKSGDFMWTITLGTFVKTSIGLIVLALLSAWIFVQN